MSKTRIISLAVKVNNKLTVPYIDMFKTRRLLEMAGLSVPMTDGIETIIENMGFLTVKDGKFSYMTTDQAYDLLLALPLPITVPKDKHDRATVYNLKKSALISAYLTGKRKVMAAAMKFSNEETRGEIVIVSGRHWDTDFCHPLFRETELDKNLVTNGYQRGSEIQGFIDNRGVFMTRSEAWRLAVENNQIIHYGGWEHKLQLFSENIY